MTKIEPTRSMVEPPDVKVQRELSTATDGDAKQPVEDSPPPERDED